MMNKRISGLSAIFFLLLLLGLFPLDNVNAAEICGNIEKSPLEGESNISCDLGAVIMGRSVTNDGTLSIFGDSLLINRGRVGSSTFGTLVNNGVTNVNKGGRLVNERGGEIFNYGSLKVSERGHSPANVSNAGYLNNFGTFTNNGFVESAGMRALQVGEERPQAGLINQTTGIIENKGEFTVGPALSSRLDCAASCQLDNLGTINNNSGSTFNIKAEDFFGDRDPNAEATLNNTGTFNNNGTVYNSGTFNNEAGGQYIQSPGAGAPPVTENKGTFTNAGTTVIGAGSFTNDGHYDQQAGGTTQISGASFTNQGEYTASGTTFVSGVGAGVAGTFTNENQVRQSGGEFVIGSGGQYVQQATGTTQIDGGTFTNQGLVRNDGTMTVAAGGQYTQAPGAVGGPSEATFNNGTFTNEGTTVIGVGPFTNQGSVVNSGTFQVAALGHVSGAGSYEQMAAGAQTIVNGTFSNNIDLQKGSLAGTGTITGAVVNTGGMVQPGSSVLPGTLTLASYTQGADARLDLKIGGLFAGSQYDVLKVAGPVSLHGGLFVSLINGFAPRVGNEFNLITGSSFDVGLRQVSLPRLLAGMDWLTSFAGGVYSLTVRQVVVSAPEPSSLLLSGVGFAWLVGWRWRKQQNRKATN